MRVLTEWAFRFRLICETMTPREFRNFSEQVIFEVMTSWAEARDYGIGGGLKQISATVYKIECGLTATLSNQLIPDVHAEELMNVIRNFAATHGVRVEGGWREYTFEEGLPIPELPEEDEE